MKVYKLVVIVVDHDELGSQGIVDEIENADYPNECITPRVEGVEERDIGEWTDDNPLNNPATSQAEIERLFGKLY